MSARRVSAITLDQNGGLISGAVKLSANADMFNIAGGTVAGNIVGSGSSDTVDFNPGSGNTFTYGSSYGFSGIHQVNVTSGTVVLNGHNTATGMTVSSGGTLAGTGIIVSSIGDRRGGHWQPGLPGTAGGTLSVTGTRQLRFGANYLDTINGASASSINISGSATLGGATVTIAAGSAVTPGKTYTILVAGGLSGTFNPTVTYGGDIGTISYVGDDVDLVFNAALFQRPRQQRQRSQHLHHRADKLFRHCIEFRQRDGERHPDHRQRHDHRHHHQFRHDHRRHLDPEQHDQRLDRQLRHSLRRHLGRQREQDHRGQRRRHLGHRTDPHGRHHQCRHDFGAGAGILVSGVTSFAGGITNLGADRSADRHQRRQRLELLRRHRQQRRRSHRGKCRRHQRRAFRPSRGASAMPA